jgi:peptidoglycan/LPS O-acetylase OafA/YrhL
MVSGFVIFLTLNKTKHTFDFVVSRFSRLYPAYWAGVLITFTCISVFGLPERETNITTVIINLTMFQQWLHVPNVDGVYWTLTLELTFYGIMLFLFVKHWLNKTNLILPAWLLLIILLHSLETYQDISVHGVIKLAFLMEYGNLFIAGIAFYRVMHSTDLFPYLIILMSLFVEYLLREQSFFFILTYYGTFLLLSWRLLERINAPIMLFFGNISYSLYLIHQNIGYIIIHQLEINNLATPISIIIIPLIFSVFIASLMYRFIENPALKFTREHWKNGQLRQKVSGLLASKCSS